LRGRNACGRTAALQLQTKAVILRSDDASLASRASRPCLGHAVGGESAHKSAFGEWGERHPFLGALLGIAVAGAGAVVLLLIAIAIFG
jgi:hypothetical protein